MMSTNNYLNYCLSFTLVAFASTTLVGCGSNAESSIKDLAGLKIDLDQPIPLLYLNEITHKVHFAECPPRTFNPNRDCPGIQDTRAPISQKEFETRLVTAFLRESAVPQILRREVLLGFQLGSAYAYDEIKREISALKATLTPTQSEYLHTALPTDEAVRLLLTDADKERLAALKHAVLSGQDLVVDEGDRDYLSLFVHLPRLGDMVPFVPIKGGTYLMGSPANETNRDSYDEGQVSVTIDDFEMMTTEMTNQAFASLVNPMTSKHFYFAPKESEMPYQMIMGEERAAIATTYLNAQMDGYHYSVPTEEIWEYAARGGTTGPIYGNTLEDVATCDLPTSDIGPLPAQKTPNAYGLYDMIGGAWDMVQRSELKPPPRPEYFETRYSTRYVGRGGSWISSTKFCRAADREFLGNISRRKRSNRDLVGLRLIRTPIVQ